MKVQTPKLPEAIPPSHSTETQREPMPFFGGNTIQKQSAPFFQVPSPALAAHPKHSALPDPLKSGIEYLSGIAMDDVKVHYDSDKPAQFQALAYAQGTDIHLATGQEKHLPHEAWHVVQQAKGKVQPSVQMKHNIPLNDDPGLEQEADTMGATAARQGVDLMHQRVESKTLNPGVHAAVVQRYTDVKSVEYKQAGQPDFEWHKSGYLEKFSQIQVFLNDLPRVKAHLDVLNQQLIRFKTNLSNLLTMLMPEWSSQMVTLVGPSPRAAFVAMARKGQLFEDYVDTLTQDNRMQHGIQSHRLQWFLIRQEFGSIAIDLFKSSVDPVWLNGKKPTRTMWDLIVDGDSAAPHDFTRPGNLQNYLDFEYEPLHGQENKIREFIQGEKAAFTQNKKRLNIEKGANRQWGEQPPEGAIQSEDGNQWSGWTQDSEGQPWAPTILETPHNLESEFESSQISL